MAVLVMMLALLMCALMVRLPSHKGLICQLMVLAPIAMVAALLSLHKIKQCLVKARVYQLMVAHLVMVALLSFQQRAQLS